MSSLSTFELESTTCTLKCKICESLSESEAADFVCKHAPYGSEYGKRKDEEEDDKEKEEELTDEEIQKLLNEHKKKEVAYTFALGKYGFGDGIEEVEQALKAYEEARSNIPEHIQREHGICYVIGAVKTLAFQHFKLGITWA